MGDLDKFETNRIIYSSLEATCQVRNPTPFFPSLNADILFRRLIMRGYQ